MCKTPVLWPQGRSFRKANHSGFRRDQLIGIFKCHQFIVRTDQQAGITLSQAIMSQSLMIFGAHLDSMTQVMLCGSLSSCNHSYTAGTISSFDPWHRTFSLLFSPWLTFYSLFSTLFHHHLLALPHPALHFSQIAFLPLVTLLLPHFPPFPPCRCLQVSCGHFSFITLSKSGTALTQGDWVSGKHREVIEFVLKWVMEGTLFMQRCRAPSGEVFRELFLPPTCCMLISLWVIFILRVQTASKCEAVQRHIGTYTDSVCKQHFTSQKQAL